MYDLNDTEHFLRTAVLDGKYIGYCADTVFKVQVGKSKGAYHTKYSFKGDLSAAVMCYKGLNIAAPYKKRLVSWSLNKPVLARYIGE